MKSRKIVLMASFAGQQWRHMAYLVAQMVKTLPAMQETWVQSLGQKDPLEKGMATHSSILAWRIPGTEEAGGCFSSPHTAVHLPFHI